VPTPSRDTVREVQPRRIGSPGSMAHPFLVGEGRGDADPNQRPPFWVTIPPGMDRRRVRTSDKEDRPSGDTHRRAPADQTDAALGAVIGKRDPL
jgi:hypothetical protein